MILLLNFPHLYNRNKNSANYEVLQLPGGSDGKESAGNAGDSVSILGWEDALENIRDCLSYFFKGLLKSKREIISLSVTSSSLQPAHQAPLSMEFSRQENWSRLQFPSLGNIYNPGIEPRSPALQTDSLPSEPPGS